MCYIFSLWADCMKQVMTNVSLTIANINIDFKWSNKDQVLVSVSWKRTLKEQRPVKCSIFTSSSHSTVFNIFPDIRTKESWTERQQVVKEVNNLWSVMFVSQRLRHGNPESKNLNFPLHKWNNEVDLCQTRQNPGKRFQHISGLNL